MNSGRLVIVVLSYILGPSLLLLRIESKFKSSSPLWTHRTCILTLERLIVRSTWFQEALASSRLEQAYCAWIHCDVAATVHRPDTCYSVLIFIFASLLLSLGQVGDKYCCQCFITGNWTQDIHIKLQPWPFIIILLLILSLVLLLVFWGMYLVNY